MFMHKGKKGPEVVEDSKQDLKNCENCESCINCDPACKESCEKMCLQLEDCKKELIESKEKLVRVTADLQNFQRRVEKEKVQWINVAQSDLLHGILSVVDDFDRAMLGYNESELTSEVKTFLDGLSMTYKSFYKFLEDNGIKEILETKTFDPSLHEAISQVDSPESTSGQIIAVAQKGYMFKGQVLRPAKVVVAR